MTITENINQTWLDQELRPFLDRVYGERVVEFPKYNFDEELITALSLIRTLCYDEAHRASTYAKHINTHKELLTGSPPWPDNLTGAATNMAVLHRTALNPSVDAPQPYADVLGGSGGPTNLIMLCIILYAQVGEFNLVTGPANNNGFLLPRPSSNQTQHHGTPRGMGSGNWRSSRGSVRGHSSLVSHTPGPGWGMGSVRGGIAIGRSQGHPASNYSNQRLADFPPVNVASPGQSLDPRGAVPYYPYPLPSAVSFWNRLAVELSEPQQQRLKDIMGAHRRGEVGVHQTRDRINEFFRLSGKDYLIQAMRQALPT